MVDLTGKRVCVAGKLVGRYASRVGELEHRVRRMGAEFLPKFDASAELVIMGAKSKGFAKRVAKSGAATLTEAELEAMVEGALDSAPAPKPDPKPRRRGRDVWQALAAHARLATHRDRHQAAIAELRNAHEHGYGIGLDETPSEDHATEVEAGVLFLCEADECRLYALAPEVPAALRRDVEALAGRSVYHGDDCPAEVLLAFVRLLGAIGQLTEGTWTRVHNELGDRDELPADGLPPLESFSRATGLAAIGRARELPSIREIFAVLDEVNA